MPLTCHIGVCEGGQGGGRGEEGLGEIGGWGDLRLEPEEGALEELRRGKTELAYRTASPAEPLEPMNIVPVKELDGI